MDKLNRLRKFSSSYLFFPTISSDKLPSLYNILLARYLVQRTAGILCIESQQAQYYHYIKLHHRKYITFLCSAFARGHTDLTYKPSVDFE